jgi:hypothetical protein
LEDSRNRANELTFTDVDVSKVTSSSVRAPNLVAYAIMFALVVEVLGNKILSSSDVNRNALASGDAFRS